ncbi:response regulator transcription factor [Streptomyces sp. NPDC102441]|uniref:response regulator transcription factor n=1 Tax=Streptomyces sp. NPDC102441 TaxID=3366176 RepID=UPI0037F228F0
MYRVLLAVGPALVRDAYAHVIAASPAFSLRAQTETLAEALTVLSTTTCDILLIETRELGGATPAAALRQASGQVRIVVLGNIPPAELVLLAGAGVTGVLGLYLEADEFLTALDVVCRGGMVISPAPSPPPAPAPSVALAPLSRREREILALVATQPDNTAIAHALGLSPFTVKTHVHRIMHKLGISSRAHLVTLAYESRLIVPGNRPIPDAAVTSANHAPLAIRLPPPEPNEEP